MLTLVFLLTGGQSMAQNLKPTEGFLTIHGGKLWYRIVGTGTGTPLLVLHGGPAVPSYYLKPLAGLGKDRPVIFYDQLGCGKSPARTDSTQWTIPQFVDELAQVRKDLNLTTVDLYGHSWGSILAVEYLKTNPKGVRSCILAGPALSIPRWSHDADSLKQTLPDSIQSIIARDEAAGTTDSKEYQAAMGVFYSMYLARKQPWSPDIDSAFMQMNPAIYGFMNGPSEFTTTGTLKGYDCTDYLHNISIPTLFICGQYDEAVPATTKYYQSLVPKSQIVIVPNAGHLAMDDDSTFYVNAVGRFLREVDGK
jgi:proline iminopeptidase